MKREMKRKAFLSNRWLYTFIALGIIAALSVGVYAAVTPGTAPDPGHLLSDVSPPTGCPSGNYIKWDGTNLVCSAISSSQWTTSGSDISYTISSGKVGIGTATPVSTLSVGANGVPNTGIYGYGSSNGVYGVGTSFGIYGSASGAGKGVGAVSATGYDFYGEGPKSYFAGNVGIGKTNPAQKLDVTGNGIFSGSVTANSFLYSSDKSLKTNIQPLQDSLSKVQQLQGVSFDWKLTGDKSIGLIAQDVEKVFPELVSGAEGSKAVAYGNIVAVLVEAIKEQQKQIEELKTQIQELKEN